MTALASAGAGAAAAPKWQLWAGRVLSALPSLMLLASAMVKLTHQPDFVQMWVGTLGYSEAALTAIGLLEIACVAVYLVPQTAVLGAVLLTGYLGGAIASHVRIDDSFGLLVVFGLLVWGGLFLRDARLRALLPLRTAAER